MWHRARLISTRQLCTATRRRINDEGDWFYSSEWWGTGTDGHTVFRSTSDKGNGIVSVLAYPSSRPSEVEWGETEKWLERRYAEEIHKNNFKGEVGGGFSIIGYQWRTLHFNDETRQSAVKVMAAYHRQQSQPSAAGSIFLMQQPHCLAVPYLKSMVSAGLATIASCNNDLVDAIYGKKTIRILCIGHGGGSLPLFLATKIQGAVVDIVEIDPLVISASIRAMGFPSFSVMNSPWSACLVKA
ncbi:SAM-DEPENDENT METHYLTRANSFERASE SUPERFAMILY PROTEIN [Salix purpurea]|uniref:SAM-DEPENDENT METHYLTRANSFERASE SUPERFAMILY PROTEIN n=1 Tax=Salix purpurea TaxID=77065 RepID=A0A9Q0Z937_SALPP|nr:SAM-DEPENDENT METHYLTRANSFERASE SUPERFAMILY PROTEIN [Salix purpurea]